MHSENTKKACLQNIISSIIKYIMYITPVWIYID